MSKYFQKIAYSIYKTQFRGYNTKPCLKFWTLVSTHQLTINLNVEVFVFIIKHIQFLQHTSETQTFERISVSNQTCVRYRQNL